MLLCPSSAQLRCSYLSISPVSAKYQLSVRSLPNALMLNAMRLCKPMQGCPLICLELWREFERWPVYSLCLLWLLHTAVIKGTASLPLNHQNSWQDMRTTAPGCHYCQTNTACT